MYFTKTFYFGCNSITTEFWMPVSTEKTHNTLRQSLELTAVMTDFDLASKM